MTSKIITYTIVNVTVHAPQEEEYCRLNTERTVMLSMIKATSCAAVVSGYWWFIQVVSFVQEINTSLYDTILVHSLFEKVQNISSVGTLMSNKSNSLRTICAQDFFFWVPNNDIVLLSLWLRLPLHAWKKLLVSNLAATSLTKQPTKSTLCVLAVQSSLFLTVHV